MDWFPTNRNVSTSYHPQKQEGVLLNEEMVVVYPPSKVLVLRHYGDPTGPLVPFGFSDRIRDYLAVRMPTVVLDEKPYVLF